MLIKQYIRHGRIKLSFSVLMFQILNAQVTDTGRYVCVAENVAGSAEKYFSLNVHGESLTNPVTAHLVISCQSRCD